ncbi:hypothetical protein KHS38_13285 [Mucilaginibacter sp. Bleaf8]|nr:hypothetical protein [Mucilaginibacter sp. Bleaf8]
MPILKSAANNQTLVVPILNSLCAGHYLRKQLPHLNIYDGCIYITGFLSGHGEVSQYNQIFRIFYGLDEGESRYDPHRTRIEREVLESKIDIHYSSSITNEIFRKSTFTSAFASGAAYYNKQASDLQSDAPYRQLFISLLKELKQISVFANLGLKESFFEGNLRILDSLSADFTASLQKDLLQQKPDERNELVYDIVRLAEKHQVHIPCHTLVANHFGYSQPLDL